MGRVGNEGVCEHPGNFGAARAPAWGEGAPLMTLIRVVGRYRMVKV